MNFLQQTIEDRCVRIIQRAVRRKSLLDGDFCRVINSRKILTFSG